jgi:hypothetical protein
MHIGLLSNNVTELNKAILNGANVNIVYTKNLNSTPLIGGK